MFSTSWDVDNYRNSYESEEHWQLRKQFMVAHKDKFPEFRLVCLTQVFFNMEFLGCKYPEKTMELVNELAKEVAEEFRESRKGKLKRTFVGAQDAAGAKAKGMKPPPGATEGSQNKQDSDVVDQPPPTKKPHLDDAAGPNKQKSDSKNLNLSEFDADLKEIGKVFVLMIPPRANSTIKANPVKIIDHNFPRKNKVYYFEGNRNDGWSGTLKVNPDPTTTKSERTKYTVAKCFSPTQGEGKHQLARNAIEGLKRFCTYVEPNPEWFLEGQTPEFIQKRIPCSKNPPSYVIMTKKDTGQITTKVANSLFEKFKQGPEEEMYFIDTEFGEEEKINLQHRSLSYGLRLRHFGAKKTGPLKDHHVCVYKLKPAAEIVEEARKLGGKHPKYKVFFKKP